MLSIEDFPGTDKTPLLQSVIASLWVDTAYQQRARPPMFLALGETNLSITKILDMFTKTTIENIHLPDHQLFQQFDLLTIRWIPGVEHLGAYLIADSQRDKNHACQLILHNELPFECNWIDFSNLTEQTFIHWERYFLEHTSTYFGQEISNIEMAKAIIHDELRKIVHIIQDRLKEQLECQTLATKRNQLKTKYQVSSFDEVLAITKQQTSQAKNRLNAIVHARKKLYNKMSNRNPIAIWCTKIPGLGKFIMANWSKENQYLFEKEFPELNFSTYEDSDLEKELENMEREYQQQVNDKQRRHQTVVTLEQKWQKNHQLRNKNQSRWQSLGIPDSFEQAEAFFDRTYRVLAFLLATHYWEARFLESARQRLQHNETPTSFQQFYNEVTMLTPCLISTLSTAPKFFKENHQYLYEIADLLIIDQASQDLPKLAAPVFAFAKKALIVGGTKQLPPIYHLPLSQEQLNLQQSELHKKEQLQL